MTEQFITLSKGDESFNSYIEGSFSKSYRALPTQNLNVNTSKEEVTFHIIPIEKIKRPSVFLLMFKLFRFEWLSLTMGPVLATFSYLYTKGQTIYFTDSLFAVFAVLFFHGGVFALNDYKDHVKGVDRLSLNGGSQVIQKGWISAIEVRRVGLILSLIGSILGIYLVLKQPFFLIAVGAFTAVAVLSYSFLGRGLKYIGFGEGIAFFSFGPMLTYGFSRAAAHYHSPLVILLGAGFGWLASLCLLSRQMENIISDGRLGVKTLAVRLGFDKTKHLIQLQLLLTPFIFSLTLYMLKVSLFGYFLIVPMTYFCLRIYLSVLRSQSSLSSNLDNLRLRMADLHIIYSTLLLISFWLIR